jgi:hypothetical protein
VEAGTASGVERKGWAPILTSDAMVLHGHRLNM